MEEDASEQVPAAGPLTPGAGRGQAVATQILGDPSAPAPPQAPASASAAAGADSDAGGVAHPAVPCAPAVEGSAPGSDHVPTWSPLQKTTSQRIRRFDRSASVQYVDPVLPAANALAMSNPAAGVAGEPRPPPNPDDPDTLVQGPITWLYAMQPKDSCIENLRCCWCMQRLMPGEYVWSPECSCKYKTHQRHECLRLLPWVHGVCEVNAGRCVELPADAPGQAAVKPEPGQACVVSVPDTLAAGQEYRLAVPDTLAPDQAHGVVPATPGNSPPELAQGGAGSAPGGPVQGLPGFPAGCKALGAAPAAPATHGLHQGGLVGGAWYPPHGHGPGSHAQQWHAPPGLDPGPRVDVPHTPQQPQQGPAHGVRTPPAGSGPYPVSYPGPGLAEGGRWEGRVDAKGVPIAWKIEETRRKREEAAAAAAAEATPAGRPPALRDGKWDTQVDAQGVPIALKAAQARERREQLKRRAEAGAAQAPPQARRRLDAGAMQDEAARQARDDAVNKRIIFD